MNKPTSLVIIQSSVALERFRLKMAAVTIAMLRITNRQLKQLPLQIIDSMRNNGYHGECVCRICDSLAELFAWSESDAGKAAMSEHKGADGKIQL